ncbi:helix-turn-helix domain-containing protein [Acidicapsa dinghuensis]|uniref:Helix-turn-helix domain-containing protein n=1 Tax=Acidicapsa dinghuensis TaxID=2218256 RepID=A0ABW1EDR2_9BACT|nr:helix-turn-helix domain-containing protein [Acidicapsa dinghuensis]
MARQKTNHPNSVEKKVIAEIRERRRYPSGDPRRGALDDPAALIYDIIDSEHANARLTIGVIAREMGVSEKTLRRRFETRYGMSLQKRLAAVRLDYALSLLSCYPVTKVAEVARDLGYADIRNFYRFFQDHMHMSPIEWCRQSQARADEEIAEAARENDESDDPDLL